MPSIHHHVLFEHSLQRGLIERMMPPHDGITLPRSLGQYILMDYMRNKVQKVH